MLTIAVTAESADEPRVAVSPDTVKKLTALGATVRIEKGAGARSRFTDDMYKAIDTVTEKIEKQIKRHKGKLIKHKGNNTRDLPEAAAEPTVDAGVDLDKGGGSIITKAIDTKPMTVEEAAMQLGMSNSEFMVFQNADTKRVNVVYKRKDSNYGHIVPRVKK